MHCCGPVRHADRRWTVQPHPNRNQNPNPNPNRSQKKIQNLKLYM